MRICCICFRSALPGKFAHQVRQRSPRFFFLLLKRSPAPSVCVRLSPGLPPCFSWPAPAGTMAPSASLFAWAAYVGKLRLDWEGGHFSGLPP